MERRAVLRRVVEPGEHVAVSQVSDGPAAEMLRFVMSHGLEGTVAKRSDSVYQPGQRTGLWKVFERLKRLETAKCPFVNLPEPAAG
jgi:ATP-dependent DNA ligase